MNTSRARYNVTVALWIAAFIVLSSFSTVSTNTVEGADQSGLTEAVELLIGSDPQDPRDPGIYVLYDDSYRTLKYNAWERYTDGDDEVILATERVVIRRGTTLTIGGYTEAEYSLVTAKDGMSDLEVLEIEGGWQVDIGSDATVGRYEFILVEGDWQRSLDIFVVFDPWTTGISGSELKGYAYDEDGTRDEYDFIMPTDFSVFRGELHPFGDDGRGNHDMYEFALAAVGNATDTREAAARIVRVVAQRCVAVPSPLHHQPIIRDASQILFGNGTTIIHTGIGEYDEFHYVGLTLEDAEILAQNGRTIHEIENFQTADRSKLINGWCDEVSWAKTALLRSVGIPSRVVSAHPTEDTDLMGHFMVEAWFERSLYVTSWDENPGGWYVLDADEWNAHWWADHEEFWMPMGETFSSRSNYRLVTESLYFGRFQSRFAFVFGPENEPEPLDITQYYYGDDFYLEYGKLTKLMGRGGGDYYKVTLEEPSRLTIGSTAHLNASIYTSEIGYPRIPIALEGFPFSELPPGYRGDEAILMPGTHYIAVYAPHNGDMSVEGDHGFYHLELEVAEDVDMDDDDVGFRYWGHLIALGFFILWMLSYVGKKRLSR